MSIYLNLTAAQVPMLAEVGNYQARKNITTREAKERIAKAIMNNQDLQGYALRTLHSATGAIRHGVKGSAHGITHVIAETTKQAVLLLENPKHKIL